MGQGDRRQLHLTGARHAGGTGALLLDAAEGVGATATARHWARATTESLGLARLVEDIELIVSELVTNAVIHAGTAIRLHIGPSGDGARIEVHDGAADRLPVASGTGLLDLLELDAVDDLSGGLTALDAETMTGRGMTLVEALSDSWGVEVVDDGKAVWAHVATGDTDAGHAPSQPAAAPVDPAPPAAAPPAGTRIVRIPGVPVRLVLTAAAQLDDLVRELQVTALPASLPPDTLDVAAEFVALTAQVRDPFRVAARAAVERQERLLEVSFPVGPAGVAALREFLAIVERTTELSTQGELLCMAPPLEVMAFRRWAVDEIARQVDGAAPRPCPFPVVPLDDPAVVVAARLAASAVEGSDAPHVDPERWLADARVALTAAEDIDQVTAAIVAAGAGLGATNGAVCLLQQDGHTVELTADVNYGDPVRDHWTTFPVTADVPASEVIRTGEPMFLRTKDELVARFPVFLTQPVIGSEALAVLPLGDGSSVHGALAIGFGAPRRFSHDDADVLRALAATVGEALARL